MLVIPKPLYWIYRRKQENKVVRTYSPGLTRFNRIFCRQLICCQYFTDSDPRQTIEDKYFAPKIPPGGRGTPRKRVKPINCSHRPTAAPTKMHVTSRTEKKKRMKNCRRRKNRVHPLLCIASAS